MNKMKKSKMAHSEKPVVPMQEKLQVRARRIVGHDFALAIDEHGRIRQYAATAEAARRYDISNGGIVRVRNVDPLKGISSLTKAHRMAGETFRETYEFCAREGMKTGAMQERVDGGRMGSGGPSEAMSIAQGSLKAAQAAIGHHEIVGVVVSVCGHGMSLREIAAKTGDPRASLLTLLRIGLDNLAMHYQITARPKRTA